MRTFRAAGVGEVAAGVALSSDAAAAQRVYDAIWRDGLEATTRVGGTISHHHGVGLLKAPYMAGEHREAMALFEAAKASLDPDGIFRTVNYLLRLDGDLLVHTVELVDDAAVRSVHDLAEQCGGCSSGR